MQLIESSALVSAVVEDAVLRSFDVRPMRRGITRAEVRRRVALCERIWQVLRIEQGWSVQRVCDHLYRFLLAELDGRSWEPPQRALWVPDGGHFVRRTIP